MSFNIPNAPDEGNGLVLGSAERLEALAWSLSQCATHGELNDVLASASFRSLTKFRSHTSLEAGRLVGQRYRDILAIYSAAQSRAVASAHEDGGNQPLEGN